MLPPSLSHCLFFFRFLRSQLTSFISILPNISRNPVLDLCARAWNRTVPHPGLAQDHGQPRSKVPIVATSSLTVSPAQTPPCTHEPVPEDDQSIDRVCAHLSS